VLTTRELAWRGLIVQLDSSARQELDALDGLKSVAATEADAVSEVTALRRTVAAMRTQVARVSGALLELAEVKEAHAALQTAHAALRAEVATTVAREIEPVREWFNVFGVEPMMALSRLRALDGQAVDAARLKDVGLASATTVPDLSITACGNVHTSYPAHYARLNNGINGCLISNARAGIDWIQVALQWPVIIGGLSWQGANSANQVYQCWKTVSLRVSLDGAVWRDADGGATFTRPAGTTDITAYSVTLATGHLCRFVRLVFHAHGAAGAGGNEYVRWELKHIPAPAPAPAAA